MQPPDFGEAPRQTQEILRESEERFRLLVEGVKDYAIFMLDAEGHITTWNLGAWRIKGYEAEEIIGEHFSIFYTDEDVERGYPDEVLRLAAADGHYEEEGIRVRKDGSTFWANVVITALRDEAGDLRGFAKVTRDITARREAEERERLLAREQAARERATDILESISDAFFAVDNEWRFTYVNSKAEEVDREGNLKRFLNNLTGVVENGLLVRAWGTQTDVTERRRAEEAQRFLAEASDMLASSLDYRETLSSVARLVVPTLADWCVVDVLDENGSLERLAVEHPDPGKVALVHKLQERYPPDPDEPSGVY
jgi:PAS domain S-box-containing protein